MVKKLILFLTVNCNLISIFNIRTIMFTELRKQYYLTHKDELPKPIEAIYRKDLSNKQCVEIYTKFHEFLKNKITDKKPVIYKRGKSEYIRYVDKIINFVSDDQLDKMLEKLDAETIINAGYIYMTNCLGNTNSGCIVMPSEFIIISIWKSKDGKDFDISISDPRIWIAFSEYAMDTKFNYVKELIYS